MRAHLFRWNDGEKLEMKDVAEPRGWRILVDPKNTASAFLSMGTQDIPPGVGIPVHVHEKEEEILFFHEGSGELEVDGERFPVSSGMSVFLPPNVSHGLRNTGTSPFRMLWIFSPPGYENVFREMAARELDHGEIEKHLGSRRTGGDEERNPD